MTGSQGIRRSDAAPGGGAESSSAPPVTVEVRALVEAGMSIRRYLFGMCGDWDQAEDLAQEALLKAWRNRGSFNGRSDVKTWIFAIARNHWVDHLRRRASGAREEAMIPESTAAKGSSSPYAAAERAELAAAIRTAVCKLPAEQREALSLRESGGLTFRQIAEMLGVPAPTVKSRVRYALLKLADELEPFRGELGTGEGT